MQNEFDWHYPSLDVQILGVNELGAPTPENGGFLTGAGDLPWIQETDNNNNNLGDIRDDNWQAAYRDVVVVDRSSNEVSKLNLTVNSLAESANYNAMKQMFIDVGKRDPLTNWQHPVEPLDVDGDSFIGPLDALQAINELPSNGATNFPGGVLPNSRPNSQNFLDVNGDGFISPLDPLPVITQLTVRGDISSRAIQAPLSGSVDAGTNVNVVPFTETRDLVSRPVADSSASSAIEERIERTDQAFAMWNGTEERTENTARGDQGEDASANPDPFSQFS